MRRARRNYRDCLAQTAGTAKLAVAATVFSTVTVPSGS